MSATRGTDRRATRSLNSSPYASARQAPKKKSSWTFGIGGLLSYINPLRSRSSDPDEGPDTNEIDGMDAAEPPLTDTVMRSPNDSFASANPQVAQNPASSLSAKGHQLAGNFNGIQQTSGQAQPNPGLMFSTPPRVASSSPPSDAHLSPAESLEKVQNFLKEKNGQALSEWETRGLLTFLEKNVQNDNEKPEPFRFSSSPSRTPARGNSPVFVFGTPGTSPATNGDGTLPRRTLSKNPNGVYRWQGGGSARPRNHYQSPSFGTRSPPPTIKLSPAKTDTKRRRVGEDADTTSSQRVPFPTFSPQKPVTAPVATSAHASTPSPSQTRPPVFPSANGTSAGPNSDASSAPKTNGTTAPRLRTSGLPTKPTAPSVPSPLRQTWGQSDSPPHTPASKPNGTPTKAANFMTELIKDVTPPKRPDVANPYQTASPVKPHTKKPVVKKPRASVKPAPSPAPVKAPEPSPQAIIEATMPKGSKRSRPPPDLAKSTRAETIPAATFAPGPSRRSPRTQTPDLPFVNGFSSTSSIIQGTKSSPVVVEDLIDDDEDDRAAKKQKTTPPKGSPVVVEEIVDVDMPSTPNPSTPQFSGPTEVIEPSDDAGSSISDQLPGLSNGFAQSPTGTSPVKPSFGPKSSAPKEPSKLRFSYKGDASPPLAAAVPDSAPAAPRISHAKLPGVNPAPPKSVGIVDPKQAVIAMAVHDLPTYSFLQPVFGLHSGVDHFESTQKAAKAMPSSSLPAFDFSTPSEAGRSTLSEPASSMPVAPKVKGFDWAGAGMKAPSATGGTWTCSTCMLSSPASATKCTVCEAPR